MEGSPSPNYKKVQNEANKLLIFNKCCRDIAMERQSTQSVEIPL